jgi:PAS domain S-box-containing protein
MKYFNRLLRDVSIRWKVVALILSVAAISLLLAGAGLLLNARTTFERETEQKLTSLADVVGFNSTAALAFQDARAATETLAALRGDRHVMAGGLYDRQGNLFARFLREDVDSELPDPAPEVDGLTFRDDRAMLLRTIELKGQPIARVYLVADTGQWSDTRWHFVGVLGALFAAVLSVGFLVAIWLQPLITQPIAELAGLMRRAGRERDYSLRAPKRGDDELGILADGFNEMLAEIGKRRVELEGARDELAQRVAELDTEVAERRRTETELRRSREQLANFIEYANIGLHWVGADGVILWANRYELETLGYSAEQYVGRHCAELHADPAVAEELMARLGRHETFENFEARLRSQDGSLRYVLINASPYLEDGKFVHTRCFTRDISERKRVEDALRHSEERYRTLVAATSAVVFTTDATGNAIERHPSWEGYTGQSWEKCAGDGWLEMVHPDDRVRVQTDWTGAATDAAVYEVEVRVWHARSQEYRYCVARAIPRRHSDGSIREWIGTVADIDERKRAEEQMRLAVDAAPNAMIMIDEHGRIVLANRELETLFGYTRAELIGQSVEILVPERLRRVHPGYRTKFFAEPHARSMGGGRDLHGKHKDGRQVPVEIGLNPFTTRDGVFCLASIIDITERKRAEQELRRFTDELQRSNRELAQFAYVASHDLQEPLRAISGCVQLLQQRYEKKLDERADELIQHAVSGTGRMQALINDLLTYSRVGTRTKPFEQCDLSRPLREALANLDLAIKECGAQVVADQMPVLDADPTQLTQLFQNLIANALKFRGDREPLIHVGAERKSGGQLVYVRDNGIGIEPQYFERIFGVFQRLHSRSKYPGNGIGLALCRKIVERHSGRIWVESEPGKGSTFYFTLPGEGAQNEQPERYSQRQ